MARGETGYITLVQSDRVPRIPCASVESWNSLLNLVAGITPTEAGTVVLDALSGIERLCAEYVCIRDFKGDWGEKGYSSFGRGPEIAAGEWQKLLIELDKIRSSGINVMILSHAKVATHRNPLGADFDRYVADCNSKVWAVTSRWADAILFGNFYSVVEGGSTGDKGRKGKGIGGTERVIYTERRDAWDAKNRYGMDECITIPDDHTKVWDTIKHYFGGSENAG
jgi:hypothetical protein